MAIGPLAASALRIGPAGLALGEQLVLAAFRSWAQARLAGEDPRGLVRPGLCHVASKPAADFFVAMMQHMEREAARRMEVHCVACGGYSQDEQRVVLACGLARAAPETTEALLAPLVRRPREPVLLAGGLNLALWEAGYRLPTRMWDEEPRATVH